MYQGNFTDTLMVSDKVFTKVDLEALGKDEAYNRHLQEGKEKGLDSFLINLKNKF